MLIDHREYPQADSGIYSSFPLLVRFDGWVYVATGKAGTHILTGQPSAEYRYCDGRIDDRVWRRKDGTVERD